MLWWWARLLVKAGVAFSAWAGLSFLGLMLFQGSKIGPEMALRAAAFLVVVALIFLERRWTNRLIAELLDRMEKAGLPAPRGALWEGRRGLFVLLLAPVFALFFALLSPQVHASQDAWSATKLSLALAWAWASLFGAWVGLVLAGLRIWRVTFAARGMTNDQLQGLPEPPQPLSVALGTSVFLVPTFLGLSGMMQTVNGLTWLAEVNARLDAAKPAEPAGAGVESLLVELGPDDQIDEVAALMGSMGAKWERAMPAVTPDEEPDNAQTWLVRVPSERAVALREALLADHENVDAVELNSAVPAAEVQGTEACVRRPGAGLNDPYYGGSGAEALGLDDVVQVLRSAPRRPGRLAIIDTGVAPIVDLPRFGAPDVRHTDPDGHGTMLASLAGSFGDNGVGLGSFNVQGRWLEVFSHPELAPGGRGAAGIANAVEEAVDEGADVILMAFAKEGAAPAAVRREVARAIGKGIVVVVSAGNLNPNGPSVIGWPANLPDVLVVEALDASRQRAQSSAKAPDNAIVLRAPGVGVCAARPDGGYYLANGTSPAAALVAGAVAVLQVRCPRTTARGLARALDPDGTGVVRVTPQALAVACAPRP